MIPRISKLSKDKSLHYLSSKKRLSGVRLYNLIPEAVFLFLSNSSAIMGNKSFGL